MSPRAEVKLNLTGAQRVVVIVSPPNDVAAKPGLSLYCGGELAGHCEDLGNPGEWCAAELLLNGKCSESGGFLLVSENRERQYPVPVSFVPHDRLGNGDWRELGLLVSSIRVCGDGT